MSRYPNLIYIYISDVLRYVKGKLAILLDFYLIRPWFPAYGSMFFSQNDIVYKLLYSYISYRYFFWKDLRCLFLGLEGIEVAFLEVKGVIMCLFSMVVTGVLGAEACGWFGQCLDLVGIFLPLVVWRP